MKKRYSLDEVSAAMTFMSRNPAYTQGNILERLEMGQFEIFSRADIIHPLKMSIYETALCDLEQERPSTVIHMEYKWFDKVYSTMQTAVCTYPDVWDEAEGERIVLKKAVRKIAEQVYEDFKYDLSPLAHILLEQCDMPDTEEIELDYKGTILASVRGTPVLMIPHKQSDDKLLEAVPHD